MEEQYLDFEKPIVELERKIEDLKAFEGVGLSDEIVQLEKKLLRLKEETFSRLTPMQRVLLARHPLRLYASDYIKGLFTDFIELHGDRLFGDDKAIIGGWALFDGSPVMVIGQQKGRDTRDKLYRNFGMPHPEGYRKALRFMKMAQKFRRPIITILDTPGAYPGIEAEERGQAEAIARNLREMSMLDVPLIVLVIGEGGSGGALAMGLGDRILMLENSIYSVCSPEACASILWRDNTKKDLAATALKLTSTDLLDLGIIDEIIPEPQGGAHARPTETIERVKAAIKRHLEELKRIPPEKLPQSKLERYSKIGSYIEERNYEDIS
jgi:acetyl-CoA carboxylase carboxyl transferase subunit alpha